MQALALLTGLAPILDRFFPDKTKQAQFAHEVTLKMAEMEATAMSNQVEVNKVEAAHSNIFVAGWRPFIGWVGGIALAWTYIGYPMSQWFAMLYGYRGPLPQLDTSDLLTLVGCLLGVGALRSYDKVRGTAAPGLGVKR